MELENESQSELVPTVAPVLLDLSTMDSEQLDQKISALVSDFAKAEGHGLTVVLPYIKEMQQVLSQRSERNKSDAGVTFSSWLTGTIKQLKSSVGKDVAVSRRTIYRRLAKLAGFIAPVKPLKIGTLVQDIGQKTQGRVVAGSAEEGEVCVSFENEITHKPEAARAVSLSELRVIRPRELEIGDLVILMDLKGGTEMKYTGEGKFAKTSTLTRDKQRENAEVAKDKKKHATGATNRVGGKAGQVSDKKAAAETKRHKAKPVTHKLVVAEDRGEKKVAEAAEPKLTEAPKPKAKEDGEISIIDPVTVTKLEPVAGPEAREGFEPKSSREFDPGQGGYV